MAVGRAIVREPKVFLFDEPLSNLDAKLRVKMRTEIARLHSRLGATMIYVTHDQVEAMTMGDKIVVMKDGIVQQVGSPLLLYDHPRNLFVAGFIGSPPMNFLQGTIVKAAAGLRAEGRGFSFDVAPEHEASLAKAVSAQVTVGVRPEDWQFAPPEREGNFLGAEVAVVEELGAETHLYLMLGKDDAEPSVVASINSHHGVHVGDAVRLTPVAQNIRYFDTASGEALLGVLGPIRMSSRRAAAPRREGD